MKKISLIMTMATFAFITQTENQKLVIKIVNNNNQHAHLTNDAGGGTAHGPVSFEIPNFFSTTTPPNQPTSVPDASFPECDASGIIIANNNNQQASLNNTVTQSIPTPPVALTASETLVSPTFLQNCWNYKEALVCATLAATYGGTIALLWHQASTITQETRWSHWCKQFLSHKEESLQLAEKLYNEIMNRYRHEEQLYGFLTPTVRFLQDITSEITYIDRYLQLQSWLTRLYLSYIFPKPSLTIPQAQHLKEHLIFAKELFLAWIQHESTATAVPAPSA